MAGDELIDLDDLVLCRKQTLILKATKDHFIADVIPLPQGLSKTVQRDASKLRHLNLLKK